jgi:predicted metal-dependent peptidase
MDVIEKLNKAKIRLVINQPFYASLVLQSEILPDKMIETAQTDGTKIWYSPAFFDSLSTDEVAGVLAHEVMHIANLHHLRMREREPERWNHACDYAINPTLVKSGLELPKGCLIDSRYSNMAAEQIYTLLPETPPSKAPQPGLGDIRKPDAGEDPKKQEDRIKQAVSQAALNQRLKGPLPDYLDRLVQEILAPKVNWREMLASYLTEIARDDYTWRKPSPRYLHQRLFLPLLESTAIGKLILILDTSGSIDGDLLKQFAGEVQDIADAFSIPLQIIYVDMEVRSIQDIEPGEPIELKAAGGGGTDFRPGFDYIQEQDLAPRAVVYMTDGACSRYPEAPDFPVLWAQFGDYPFEPPFGDQIRIS